MDIQFLISFFTLIPLTLCSWSHWSKWSVCSRTCGGGIAQRTRDCLAKNQHDCIGESVKYKVCRLRPCPKGIPDAREEQCTSYNSIPYQNKTYIWTPDTDPDLPCAVKCRARNGDLSVVLAETVLDGTRCSRHSKATCINGKCLIAGCDNIVASGKRRDLCGVCGGDGSTCTTPASNKLDQGSVELDQILPVTNLQTIQPFSESNQNERKPANTNYPKRADVGAFDYQNDGESWNEPVLSFDDIPTYIWQETDFSECSVTCGQGIETTSIVCKKVRTREIVEDQRCEGARKPVHRQRVCDTGSTCEGTARWSTGVWGDCSKTCGGGFANRPVSCVRFLNNGGFVKTSPEECLEIIPDARKRCNDFPCPTWHAGQWSPCSVTCGIGEQFRPVVCKRLTEDVNCPADEKPVYKQECHTGVICIQRPGKRRPEIDNRVVVDNTNFNKPVRIDPPKDNRGSDFNSYGEFQERPGGVWDNRIPGYSQYSSLDFDYEHVGYRNLEYNGNDIVDELGIGSDYDYRGNEVMASHGGSGDVDITSYRSREPSYVASSWGKCSVTCGHGVRKRFVQCKVFMAYTNTAQELPDSRCTDPKPAERDVCIMPNCPITVAAQGGDSYAWQFAGYQACSATCGGGFRSPLFYCLRQDPRYHIQVDESWCSGLPRPKGVLMQSCNDFPCPARWKTYTYGQCSHRCGGGTMQRQVDCVRDEGREGQINRVPDDLCRGIGLEAPSRTKLCGQVACPPQWVEGQWSSCSATCGQGFSSRQVLCKRVIPPSREVEIMLDQYCDGAKPQERKPCEAENKCARKARMNADPSHYVQLQPRSHVRLVAGGAAVIIPGAVLRVRCPVTNFPRDKITWTKEGADIDRKGRVKKSRRGVLHIRASVARDQGIYTCHADSLSAPLTLRFHSQSEALQKYLEREKLRDQQFLSRFRQQITQDSNHKEAFTEPYLFKHFDRYTLPFNFVASHWGTCSRSCGGAGLQSRKVTCEINFDQYYLIVKDDFCYEIGLDKPLTTQDCGFEQCPVWEEGRYAECSDSYCLGPGTGSRVRPLFCIAPHNGSRVPLRMCDQKRKPQDKLPCPKETCVATWKETDWTQCSKTCGGTGYRTRSLLCMWVPNNRPANGHCDGLIKPEVITSCEAPKCPQTSGCRDESSYCSLVDMMDLCRYREYRTKCCKSCARRYRLRH